MANTVIDMSDSPPMAETHTLATSDHAYLPPASPLASPISSPSTPTTPNSSDPLTLHTRRHTRQPSATPSTASCSTVRSRPLSICTSHREPHFGGAEVVRDVIIGLSDGLTVPFALAAGLSTLDDSHIVVTAGLAEIVAGSISMGLGGFLAGLSEVEHYESERKREAKEVDEVPAREEQEIVEIFEPYGLDRKALKPLLNGLKADKEAWVDFMMKFELNMEKPDASRSWISALTIGLSYLLGGFVPLLPYYFEQNTQLALGISAGVTVLALLVFGYVKAMLMGTPNPMKSALQMAVIGAAAAGAAFGIARAISH